MEAVMSCGKTKNFPPPSSLERKNGWLQLDISLRLGFSYYIWQKHFQPPNDTSDECKFMRAAALQCSLLNIRTLDEFFRPQMRRADIRAAHYAAFKNPGPFLSDEEVKQLHQMIAHLTYRRFREFDTKWNTFDLLKRAYNHLLLFFDYLSDVEFADQVNIRASIGAMKKRSERWLAEMALFEPPTR
jgi:hypothetical protein